MTVLDALGSSVADLEQALRASRAALIQAQLAGDVEAIIAVSTRGSDLEARIEGLKVAAEAVTLLLEAPALPAEEFARRATALHRKIAHPRAPRKD